MATNIIFTSLPTELFQRFALFLPPKDVLSLVLACRKAHDACDNLVTWRQIIRVNSGFPLDLSLLEEQSRQKLKQLAVVDAEALSFDCETDSLSWLPQAMALRHKIHATTNTDWLFHISDPSHHRPDKKAFDRELPSISDRPSRAHPPDIESPIDIDGWRLAQVGSFCFAVHLLYRSSLYQDHLPRLSSRDKFSLEKAQWTEIETIDANSQPAEYSKMTVILHTFANKAIGAFAAQLSDYLADEWESTGLTPNGSSHPPKTNTIPFSSFMNLPEFFAPSSIDTFTLCHVPKMATPSFFEDGQWAGYSCFIHHELDHEYNPTGPLRYNWDGIGGENRMVQLNNLDQPPQSSLNPRKKHIERYAKFKLSHWIDVRFFVVQSNYFQSQKDTFRMTLKVDSVTGIVSVVRHVNFDESPLKMTGLNAVVTPFGLFFGGYSPDYWLWLWKLDWTPSSEDHFRFPAQRIV